MSQQKNSESFQWNGTNQGERMLKALNPDFIKIDERSSSDFLAFASKYSEMLAYFDLNNSQVGNWSKFFNNDLSVFIASIIATDTKKIENEHKKLIIDLENAPRLADKLDVLSLLFLQVFDLAKILDGWYVNALNMNRLSPGETDDLENELENAIKQQLSGNLNELMQYAALLEFQNLGNYDKTNIKAKFHKIWFNKVDLLSENQPEGIIQKNLSSLIDFTKKTRIQFRTFYSVISYIIQIAPKFLEKSLQEKDDHRPDIALFIAFIELFKNNQKQLNTLTEKHLDFYYYDVLRLKERNLKPDQVNIYFKIAQHVDTFYLPEGSLLYAGMSEEGTEVLYETDSPIEINSAQISDLKTLFVSKNPKIGIGSSYRLITNLYAAPIANSKNGLGERFTNNEEEWPLFGEELLEKTDSERQMTYAEIGWALSSPILEMEEGHREVSMKLEFEKDSMHTLNLLIKDISKNQEISREDAFSKIFKNSLNVFLSSTDGWVKANICEVLPPNDWSESYISLQISISSASAAITGYRSDILGSSFDTDYPVMKIIHQNNDVIYSYSFLKELILKRINLDVNVKGIKKLMLFNEYGLLESSIPFQPFSAVPKPGSYLLVGKSELFKKQLTDIQFNIEWHNIPDNKRGLRGYYKEYNLNVANDSFKVKISALSEGTFKPATENNHKTYRLFEDDQKDSSKVSNKTIFGDLDLKSLDIKANFDLSLPSIFNSDVDSGYFKIELAEPAFGFGHEDYPNIYTAVITQNADPKRKGPELPLPKQPWTPTIRNISVDYAASSQINILSVGTLSNSNAVPEKLYHIHPFGIISSFVNGRPLNRSLLPAYDDDAYLYLGIKDLQAPSPLSIYFELKENLDYFSTLNTNNKDSKQNELTWSYLVNNEWKTFSQNQILSDSTHSLNNSGIVLLEIPRDINNQNNILESGKYWIRIALRGEASKMPKVLHMATQAVTASWKVNEKDLSHLKNPLTGNNIRGLLNGVAQIREVCQPFQSFGGRAKESNNEFYTRVSERLRHKNRAISTWDYERIILEQFPDLLQVKCVTHNSAPQWVPKGSVLIVVVPKINHESRNLPMLNNTVLEKIKQYIKPLSSPFVNIELRNPVYERIKISAAVQFVKGKNNGTFLKKLNHDIMEFVCPWLFGKASELELGGSLAKDMILNFIEKTEYVEFVTKFSAVQVFPTDQGFDVDDTALNLSSSPTIKATRPWSVLIPFVNNPIYLLEDLNYQSPEKAGIDSMMLDGDFVMTTEKN
jgi:hypothetical protein